MPLGVRAKGRADARNRRFNQRWQNAISVRIAANPVIHVAEDGRVLAPPVQIPGVRSPQNPFLRISDRGRVERLTLAASRGFEGLAISPDWRSPIRRVSAGR